MPSSPPYSRLIVRIGVEQINVYCAEYIVQRKRIQRKGQLCFGGGRCRLHSWAWVGSLAALSLEALKGDVSFRSGPRRCRVDQD